MCLLVFRVNRRKNKTVKTMKDYDLNTLNLAIKLLKTHQRHELVVDSAAHIRLALDIKNLQKQC